MDKRELDAVAGSTSQVMLHALRETVRQHEETIRTLINQLDVATGQLHQERDASHREQGASAAVRHALHKLLHEQQDRSKHLTTCCDVVTSALRTLVRAVERLVDLTEYTEPYDPIAVAYREACELLAVIDARKKL